MHAHISSMDEGETRDTQEPMDQTTIFPLTWNTGWVGTLIKVNGISRISADGAAHINDTWGDKEVLV